MAVAAKRLDASLLNVLRSMHGSIIGARIAYPNVLHVEIRDKAKGVWRLATQDASWTPKDPATLIGCSVVSAEVDQTTGELRCQLSDKSWLSVTPARSATEGDPPSWELFTPTGLVLEFGPGLCWQLVSADKAD